MLDVQKILKLIQPDGLISRLVKRFEPRISQQKMMENVIDAYNHNHIALIEAGTGTGKSLAYLIPALIWASLSKERTVVSTHTLTLQEQLIHKDIPHLLKSLNLDLKVVLVKGMNHYLCLRKLHDAQSEFAFFPNEDKSEIERIDCWRKTTIVGSRAEMPFTPSPSSWERVRAESEACSANQCPYYQECFFFKARREAQEAHLLVVNHHLLFADLFKRSEAGNYSESAILPVYNRLILDEAHHIEEIATEYFANRVHRIELLRILSKLTLQQHQSYQGKLIILKEKVQSLFYPSPPRDINDLLTRLTIDLPALRHALVEQIHQTFDACIQFIEWVYSPKNEIDRKKQVIRNEQKLRLLEKHRIRPEWMDQVVPKLQELINALKHYSQSLRSLEADFKFLAHDQLNEHTKSVRLDIQSLTEALENATTTLDRFLSGNTHASRVHWIELHRLNTLINVHLVDSDLNISKTLAEVLFSRFPTIILCSATLASNQQFSFIRRRYGMTLELLPSRQIKEYIYDSPFDYRKQAILAVPIDMPLPNHPEFDSAVYENIWQAIEASQGRAFVLFTSYLMLKNCNEVLADRLKEKRYPLFIQGDDSRKNLLNQFKSTDRAVLFGTNSFWEGVDVAGDALRCVIIVKLPFKVPSDPLIEARTEAILEAGGDPFLEFSIPQAIIKFKQGFGRLIRHRWDRGCIVCLDTRLVKKSYGKLFLESLPPCETLFMSGETLWPKVAEFYRRSYYFVKQSPF